MSIISQNEQKIHVPNRDSSADVSERAYAQQYVQQLLNNKASPGPPDLTRSGQYGTALLALVPIHKSEGPQGVREALETLKGNSPYLADLLPDSQQRQRIYTAAEFMERPPTRYLDDEKMIAESSLNLIYGQPGSCKSLLVMSKLAAIADDVPVLLVLGEGQGGTPDRLRAEQMARGRPLSDEFCIYPQAFNLRDSAQVREFIDEIRSRKPKLIAIDTLSTCIVGADENNAKDMTPVIKSCASIQTELGAAIILIHHSTKDGKTYRGSSVLHGAVDAMYHISQNNGRIELSCQKSKDLEKSVPRHYRIMQLETRTDPDTGEPVTGAVLKPEDQMVVPPIERLTTNERRILETLASLPQGASYSQLRELTGIAKGSLSPANKKLQELGYIQHENRGLYVPTEGGRAVLQEVQEVQNGFN